MAVELSKTIVRWKIESLFIIAELMSNGKGKIKKSEASIHYFAYRLIKYSLPKDEYH